ncbi:MAG TPA: 1-deoxy-D-xylulose-5-phosphate synthase [Longimicrobiales bacterium]|nr:1-deoxy-D-xylulose-5-phosphate synthase [Longimicrobiales bacterium]
MEATVALLDRIEGPADLRTLPRGVLATVAQEVRERMIDVVSRVGGHFAPGLGVVELTLALHYVFDTPRDKLIWDVGHQGYPHKILTGRNAEFPRIRQKGGPSGFLKRDESEYDVFGAGHAATSISAAFGIATARDLNGEDFEVVAIIGDGSLTSGIAYEALNNAGNTDTDLIVILNDNEMSISPNVGAIHKYLTRLVTNPVYNAVRNQVKNLIHKTPAALGDAVESMVLKLEESVKNMLVPGTLFEELGFRYVGPVDGHDLDALLDTLVQVRKWKGPRLVHVRTVKGKGFQLAEANPVVWHGATPFDKLSGEMPKKKGGLPAYTNAFGAGLVELGATNPKMVVITAAMPGGTGTGVFGDAYPERYFDVGIAEGHAVTFAAGLATEGIKPVAAIYSTFLQRAYDSIIHDVAIQKLPVVLAMDRAGLVGNDGPTHMGLYDIPYLLAVPNFTVTAPKDGAEMLALLRLGVEEVDGPFSLRYPRDTVPAPVPPLEQIPRIEYGTWEVLRRGEAVAILAVGTMVAPAVEAAQRLQAEGIEATVVNCRFLKPMDRSTLAWAVERHPAILTVEEGTVVNGFGAALEREIEPLRAAHPELRVDILGVPDRIVEHANRAEQLEECGLTPEAIADRARKLVGGHLVPVRETA